MIKLLGRVTKTSAYLTEDNDPVFEVHIEVRVFAGGAVVKTIVVQVDRSEFEEYKLGTTLRADLKPDYDLAKAVVEDDIPF